MIPTEKERLDNRRRQAAVDMLWTFDITTLGKIYKTMSSIETPKTKREIINQIKNGMDRTSGIKLFKMMMPISRQYVKNEY